MQIASAITTCPRAEGVSYMEQTLASLRAAGFDPIIHDDPEKQGSWPSLRNALQSLLTGFPEAEALMVCQDDIIVSRGLYDFLQRSLWPAPYESILVCSLYTAESNRQDRQGWFDMNQIPVFRPFGACCLVFARPGAERFLRETRYEGLKHGSDCQTGSWARKVGLGYYSHTPSLVQHVGALSSIGIRETTLDRNRSAGDFCEDCALL